MYTVLTLSKDLPKGNKIPSFREGITWALFDETISRTIHSGNWEQNGYFWAKADGEEITIELPLRIDLGDMRTFAHIIMANDSNGLFKILKVDSLTCSVDEPSPEKIGDFVV